MEGRTVKHANITQKGYRKVFYGIEDMSIF